MVRDTGKAGGVVDLLNNDCNQLRNHKFSMVMYFFRYWQRHASITKTEQRTFIEVSWKQVIISKSLLQDFGDTTIFRKEFAIQKNLFGLMLT